MEAIEPKCAHDECWYSFEADMALIGPRRYPIEGLCLVAERADAAHYALADYDSEHEWDARDRAARGGEGA